MSFMKLKVEDLLMEKPTNEYNNLITKMTYLIDEVLYKNLSVAYKEFMNISEEKADKKLLSFYYNHEKYSSNKMISTMLSCIFLVLSVVCLAFITTRMFRGDNTDIIWLFIQFACIALGVLFCSRLNFYMKLDFLNYIEAFVYCINQGIFDNDNIIEQLLKQILEEIQNNKGV